MAKLFTAMTTNDAVTTNGMVTNSTSSNHLVDMFFKMGGSRNMSVGDIERMFSLAFYENPGDTLKALFYNRDIREGQGERRSFRVMFKWLCDHKPLVATRLLPFVPEYGRWDDVLVALDTQIAHETADFLLSGLKSRDKLCAKWLPRENKSGAKYAKFLMKRWNLTPRAYRKALAGNTDVVETKMCNREWSAIDYNHMTSKSSHLYRNALLKHDEERYREYLGNLTKVDANGRALATVNAGAIFPHDIIRPLLKGTTPADTRLINAQWKALPNYSVNGSKVLPVCDVSGSMGMGTGNGLPLLVSVSLGLYTSERNNGIFKDGFITFSRKPTLVHLNGATIEERIKQFKIASIAENTDLYAVFKLILDSAVRSKCSVEDMPDTILILSDMQFDSPMTIVGTDKRASEMIRAMYRESGYPVPNVVFWNLNTSQGVPVKYNENGVALVSGFSPSILKSILSGEINPVSQMNAVLHSERYAKIN